MTKAVLLTVTAVAAALTRRQTLNFAQSLDESTIGHTTNCQLSRIPKFRYLFHNGARLVFILGQIR